MELKLSEAEREETRDARAGSTTQALALRARIVLERVDGLDNNTVATKVWSCPTPIASTAWPPFEPPMQRPSLAKTGVPDSAIRHSDYSAGVPPAAMAAQTSSATPPVST